jgi:hypothetical protein
MCGHFCAYNHCRPPTYPAPIQNFWFSFCLYSLFNVSSLLFRCLPPISTCSLLSIYLVMWKAIPFVLYYYFTFCSIKSNQNYSYLIIFFCIQRIDLLRLKSKLKTTSKLSFRVRVAAFQAQLAELCHFVLSLFWRFNFGGGTKIFNDDISAFLFRSFTLLEPYFKQPQYYKYYLW